MARKVDSAIAATVRALYGHVLAPLDALPDAATQAGGARVVAELIRTPVGLRS